PGGGIPSQTISASSPAATTRPARTSIAASSTRCRAAGIAMSWSPSCTSIGPNSPNFIQPPGQRRQVQASRASGPRAASTGAGVPWAAHHTENVAIIDQAELPGIQAVRRVTAHEQLASRNDRGGGSFSEVGWHRITSYRNGPLDQPLDIMDPLRRRPEDHRFAGSVAAAPDEQSLAAAVSGRHAVAYDRDHDELAPGPGQGQAAGRQDQAGERDRLHGVRTR